MASTRTTSATAQRNEDKMLVPCIWEHKVHLYIDRRAVVSQSRQTLSCLAPNTQAQQHAMHGPIHSADSNPRAKCSDGDRLVAGLEGRAIGTSSK